MNLLIDLFTAILIFASGFCIGSLIVKRFSSTVYSRVEFFFMSLGIGLVFVSCFTFAAGALGLLQRWLFFFAGLSVIAIYLLIHKKFILKLTLPRLNLGMVKYTFLEKFAMLSMLVSIIFNLFFSYSPPTSEDEVMYHLFLPKTYVEHKAFVLTMPTEIMSYYPQITGMIYTIGMLIRGDLVPKLTNYIFGLILLALTFYLGDKYFNRKTAIFAGCIFYTSPFCTQLSGVAHADLALGFYGLLCIIAILLWIESNYSIKLLALVGFIAGTCISIKYPGIGFPILCFIVVLWHQFKRKAKGSMILKEWIVLGFTILLVFSPWILRNYLLTGNIFAPLNMISSRPHLQPVSIFSKSLKSIPSDLFHALHSLFHGSSPHSPGALFAFFPLVIFARQKPKIINFIVIVSAIHFLANYIVGMSGSRYFATTYLLLSLISGHTIAELQEMKCLGKYLYSLFIIAVLCPNLIFGIYLGGKRIPVFLGVQSREDYLRKEYDGRETYDTVEFCNKNLSSEKIFVLSHDFVLPYYYRNEFVTNNTVTFLGMKDIREVLDFFKQEEVGYFMIWKKGFLEKNGIFVNKFWPLLRLNWFTEENRKKYFELIYQKNYVEIYKIKDAVRIDI